MHHGCHVSHRAITGQNRLPYNDYATTTQIKSRYIDAAGAVDPNRAHSWTFSAPPPDSGTRRFLPLLAEAEPGDGVTLIGRREYGTNADAVAYRLTPGDSSNVVRLVARLCFEEVSRDLSILLLLPCSQLNSSSESMLAL